MVRPKNGQNYDSFIFDQYFSTKVDGVYAPTINTLNIITLIDNLPINVTLNDEAQIVAARQAYDSLTSEEQKSLISNYENLVRAESTLAYLKSREETPVDPTDPTEPTEPSKFAIFMKNNMYGFILSGIITIGFTVALVLVIKKKKRV